MYFLQHWLSKGVKFIGDLVNEHDAFLSLEEFKNAFNVNTNFLDYGGVLRAIRLPLEKLCRKVQLFILHSYRSTLKCF